MGETMAETLRDQIEIEKHNASAADFKQSISFGRFENDLLSWERWSSFSQNKYLEEVGKCSTPGSVAKKKAYFEAHYKKIAARKAEMDQEQEMGGDSFRSDNPNYGNPTSNGFGTKLEFDTSGLDGVSMSMEPDNISTAVSYTTLTEEPNQDVVGMNSQDLYVENVREETDDLLNSPKSDEFEKAVSIKHEDQCIESQDQSEDMFELVIEDINPMELAAQSLQVGVLAQEENNLVESQDPLEQSHQLDNEASHVEANRIEDAKPKLRKEPQKRTPTLQDKSLVKTKKKPVPPTTKTTRTSLPRASKVAPASPTSKISTRKETSPSLLKKSSQLAVKKKAATPNTLHKSLNLESTNSDLATPSTTRKSFIMEKMGDKDIVKRAFKTFQNNFSLSTPSGGEKPSSTQQVSTKRTARVASTSMTPQKDKERMKKTVENPVSQRSQVGARTNSVSARPTRGVGQQQTSGKASLSSFGLKSDEREEKRKQLSKKLEKSNVKETGRTRLPSQSKEKKETEVKKLSQSLNFKSTNDRSLSGTKGVQNPCD